MAIVAFSSLVIEEDQVKKGLLKFSLALCLVIFLASGCGEHRITGTTEPPPSSYVQPQGRGNAFDLATWNLEYFPLTASTVDEVAKIIAALDIDCYAIQEINDTTAFGELLRSLPEYDGLCSWDDYSWGYLKTGIIYKRSVVSVSQTRQIFEDDWYAFTRPPLEAHILAHYGSYRFDFVLIVMHLKAGTNAEDRDRREEAIQKLNEYLGQQVADNSEKDYIVAGDWNDELDAPQGENVFTVLLDHPESYRFLTAPLAGQFDAASYPRYGNLIDHILITQDAFAEYEGGYAKTLRLDDEISNYLDTISDHRPVMASFPVFGK
jgi:exonuclease III